MKKWFNVKFFMRFIMYTFVFSIIYITVRIVLAPSVAPVSDITIRVKSDYILMLLQSIFGVFAMLLPGFLMHKVKLSIPTGMLVAYAGFLYCAIYLGEVRNFYYNMPHWDTILHIFSGAAIGALGFSIVALLNKSELTTVSLSPLFVAMFAFGFALALGVLWEIYEFAVDYIFRTNMQKYALENGQALVGQAALMDTMKDLIVDSAGALVMSVVGYVSLKYKKGWLEKFQVKRK